MRIAAESSPKADTRWISRGNQLVCIFDKLEVASRAELAAYMAARESMFAPRCSFSPEGRSHPGEAR